MFIHNHRLMAKRSYKRLGQDEIVRRIQEIHGQSIDASFVHCTNTNERILLRCTICGHQWEPYAKSVIHAKSGCPSCAGNLKITTQMFIDRARLIHENKFDYSLIVDYQYRKKISIICNTCNNVTKVSSHHHLKNEYQCPWCRRTNTCDKCGLCWAGSKKCSLCEPKLKPKNLYHFLSLAISVHGKKFNYSKSLN
jgi:hypothetical protein